jgi:hypothetical protein
MKWRATSARPERTDIQSRAKTHQRLVGAQEQLDEIRKAKGLADLTKNAKPLNFRWQGLTIVHLSA